MTQSRATSARGREAAAVITATLQQYADRGVFRGFRAEQGRGGRVRYTFSWLTRVPMSVVFDPARNVLSFPAAFHGIEPRSPIVGDLKAMIEGRSDRRLPAHKRLDLRKARVACSRRKDTVSLALTIKGTHHEYAVRNALNLVNELFLLLHQTYPEYLIDHFGASPE